MHTLANQPRKCNAYVMVSGECGLLLEAHTKGHTHTHVLLAWLSPYRSPCCVPLPVLPQRVSWLPTGGLTADRGEGVTQQSRLAGDPRMGARRTHGPRLADGAAGLWEICRRRAAMTEKPQHRLEHVTSLRFSASSKRRKYWET